MASAPSLPRVQKGRNDGHADYYDATERAFDLASPTTKSNVAKGELGGIQFLPSAQAEEASSSIPAAAASSGRKTRLGRSRRQSAQVETSWDALATSSSKDTAHQRAERGRELNAERGMSEAGVGRGAGNITANGEGRSGRGRFRSRSRSRSKSSTGNRSINNVFGRHRGESGEQKGNDPKARRPTDLAVRPQPANLKSNAAITTPRKGGDGGNVSRLAAMFAAGSGGSNTPVSQVSPSTAGTVRAGQWTKSSNQGSTNMAGGSKTSSALGHGTSYQHNVTTRAADESDERYHQNLNSNSASNSFQGALHNMGEELSLASSGVISSDATPVLPAAAASSFMRRGSQHPQSHQAYPPASPGISATTGYTSTDASDAYVGWPGTQDEHGRTVSIKPSYSRDSETTGLRTASVAGSGSRPSDWINAEDVLGGESDTESSTENAEEGVVVRARTGLYHEAALDDAHGLSSERDFKHSSDVIPPYRMQRQRSTRSTSTIGSASVTGSRAGAPFARSTPLSPRTRLHMMSTFRTDGNPVERIEEEGDGIAVGQVINVGTPDHKQRTDIELPKGIDITGSASRVHSVRSSGRGLAASTTKPLSSPKESAAEGAPGKVIAHAPTEAALREQERRFSPPQFQKINPRNLLGYRGFFNKTQDLPNLMDGDDSESMAETSVDAPASRASYDLSGSIIAGQRQIQTRTGSAPSGGVNPTSDVFEGVSNDQGLRPRSGAVPDIAGQRPSRGSAVMNILSRGRAQTFVKNTAQPSKASIQKYERVFPSKASLRNDPMVEYDRQAGSTLVDLYEYFIPPDQVKKMVRKYREMFATQASRNDVDLEMEEDRKKAFALFEMRSRIMETDIDRGLERSGGTVPVDDIVTTPYFMAALRVRDAVVVSKAWRDGATPRDVITASLLTRREARTHYVTRRDRYGRVGYEEVLWFDDTDFMQLRCPSLGPRIMRGFEMFTIGDCQSILLKITHERCQQLQSELKSAIRTQLLAERRLKAEERNRDSNFDDSRMMSVAEENYLEAVENVKETSMKLIHSERAFALVKERIETLITKYAEFLVRVNNDDESVVSFGASSYSQSNFTASIASSRDTYGSSREKKEAMVLGAKRAEILAEMTARQKSGTLSEAMMKRKQVELDELQAQLASVETNMNGRSKFYQRGSAAGHPQFVRSSVVQLAKEQASTIMDQNTKQGRSEEKERIKARFRSRRAEKMRQDPFDSEVGASQPGISFQRNRMVASTNEQLRLAGEEMYSHLDFYERSLKAVTAGTS